MAVELYDPKRKYVAAAGAHLTYRGGPLLQHAKLVGVFIDDPATGNPHSLTAQLGAFLSWYGSSDLITELAEYNISGPASYVGAVRMSLGGSTPPPPPPPVPGPPPPPPVSDCSAELDALIACLGYGSAKPARHRHKHVPQKGSLGLPHRVAQTKAGVVVQDSDLQSLLHQGIVSGRLPDPDNSMLYVMYLPAGVSVQLGSDESCVTFCGYHDAFQLSDGTYVYYAILPYPSCSGCLGGLSALDSLTAITSHEISEAITDPVPGEGYYDDQNGEIGDICAWTFRQDGPYNVQLEWSNKHNACI